MRTVFAALLLTTALATPVLAQAPAAGAQQPAAAPGAAQTGQPGAAQPPMGAQQGQVGAQQGQMRPQQAGAGNIQFITQNRPGLWRATEVRGLRVDNDAGDRIGSIDEILFDRQGQVEAVVIGVGGFLGIGQRDVAIPFNSLQWAMRGEQRTAGAVGTGVTGARQQTTGAAGPAGTGTAGTGAAGAGPQTGAPAATGTVGAGAQTGAGNARTGATGAAQTGGAQAGQMADAPERAILPGATQDMLRNAPEFRYAN
jgi:hypothetical protein